MAEWPAGYELEGECSLISGQRRWDGTSMAWWYIDYSMN